MKKSVGGAEKKRPSFAQKKCAALPRQTDSGRGANERRHKPSVPRDDPRGRAARSRPQMHWRGPETKARQLLPSLAHCESGRWELVRKELVTHRKKLKIEKQEKKPREKKDAAPKAPFVTAHSRKKSPKISTARQAY